MKTIINTLILIATLSLGTELTAQKFGYINSQALIQEMPDVKAANSEIDILKGQLQKKGENMVKDLQTKYADLERKQQSGEISPKQLEGEAAKLKEEESKILEYEQTSQEMIAQKGNVLFKPIQDKVNQAIKDIAAEAGYTYIFDTSLGIILYADESTDLTVKVKAKLGIQ